uniref:Ig-like domain-containing protein n=1 Tax=Zonotrichia albicollis TaxID=44394 RepID=A0A8D2MTC0_ZONAL
MAGGCTHLSWCFLASSKKTGGVTLETQGLAVLWDQVTLTCQGSGTANATTWYRNGQRWGQKGCDRITVTESGTYTCERPSSGLSPSVTVLQGKRGLCFSGLAPMGTPRSLVGLRSMGHLLI